ncbi:MAG: hypothetical protein AB1633_11270, partial [Elusimicrobiota bacterium]
MPELLKAKPDERENPKHLITEIENFIKESHSGVYVSWVNEHDWYSEGEEDEHDYSNFESWTETFTDFLIRTINMSKQAEHKTAVECFDKLFKLLQEASDTTDILGNQGVPEDNISVDFLEAIACYTQSLFEIKGKDKFEEILDTATHLAKKYKYRDGYKGLVEVLNSEQRKILSDRLWQITKSEWKEHKERTAPDEVDGLIAIAEAEKNKQEVLSIKEQFAKAHAGYLKDVLTHYEKKKDWESVTKWAKIGLTHFGQHKDYSLYLVKAKENLGDKAAVLDAKVNYFLEDSSAEEFEEVRRYANSISKWPEVYEKIVKVSEKEDKYSFENPGLKIKLFLAEGHEKEAFEYFKKNQNRFEIELIKLIAKYCLARIISGKDLSNFKELKTLDKRSKTEKDDLYDWLRIALRNPATLKNIEYIKLCVEMYKLLINFHLTSGKSSRVDYARYYCSVVKELSDLLNDTTIWSNLIQYMTQVYQKKRLIWENLRERGLIK